MSAICGDTGGMNHRGKPCGRPPARRVQDLAGRCHQHGDLAGEPHRKVLAEAYRKAEEGEGALEVFREARTVRDKARRRAEGVILEARPVFDELATATKQFEEAARVLKKLGMRQPPW